jgi:hypothetical protein
MIVNSFQEMCTMKMVVHCAVMLQPTDDVYGWETCQRLSGCTGSTVGCLL